MARHYMVQAGDTLSEIARRFYGDASLFKALANANEIADPNKIKTGQVLTLPDPPGRWYPVMSSAYFGGVIINTLFVLDVPAGMRLVIENISGRYTGRNWVLSAAQLCYEPSDGGLQTWGYFPWIQCGPEHDPAGGSREHAPLTDPNVWRSVMTSDLSVASELLDWAEDEGYRERELIVLGNSTFLVRWRYRADGG